MVSQVPMTSQIPVTSQEPGSWRISRLAVIGAGATGVWLAQRAASAGYLVTLEDLLPGRRRAAAAQLDRTPGAGWISYVGSVEEACREADLVVDFVPDELESKLEILSLLDRMAPPHTIFATPTHALSIADLASCTYRPERCVAIRFSADIVTAARFSVEIIQTPPPSPSSLREEIGSVLASFWQSLGAEVTFSIDSASLP